mgnify:CR=1 FL=1
MMKKILILFLASTACLTLEVFSEITPEEDLEIIRKAIEERRKKDPIRSPTEEEKKAMDDYAWMVEVWGRHEQRIREWRAERNNLVKEKGTGIEEIDKPTQDELRRAKVIYKNSKKSSSPYVKSTGMLAFTIFLMAEPMKKWYPEMKRLISSDDEIEVGVGVGSFMYVLESGSGRQQQALANDESLYGLLPGIKKTYSGNTAMMGYLKRIEKAAAPFQENNQTTTEASALELEDKKDPPEEEIAEEKLATAASTDSSNDPPASKADPATRSHWLWLGLLGLFLILIGILFGIKRR